MDCVQNRHIIAKSSVETRSEGIFGCSYPETIWRPFETFSSYGVIISPLCEGLLSNPTISVLNCLEKYVVKEFSFVVVLKQNGGYFNIWGWVYFHPRVRGCFLILLYGIQIVCRNA